MMKSIRHFFASGTPWIWLNAGAVAISIVMTVGLLLLLAVNGLGHFWPKDILRGTYEQPVSFGDSIVREIIGERVSHERVTAERIISSGIPVAASQDFYERELVKIGNRDLNGSDFTWLLSDFLTDVDYPKNLAAFERREWGNFYGYVQEVKEQGQTVAVSDVRDESDARAWNALEERVKRALSLHEDIVRLEKGEIGEINYALERIRLRLRGLELREEATPERLEQIEQERAQWDARYEVLQGTAGAV